MAPDRDDDDLDDLEDPYDDDEGDEAPQTEVTVEITGLSLYTHHGVSAAEREVGQRLVLDLRLEVGECDATVTDMVDDTVDYASVCERVALVAQQRSYKTLERLCSAIADRLLADYAAVGGVGQGDEARAADPAAGRVGVGRGLAPGRRVTAPGATEFDRATAVTPLGDGAWAADIDAGLVRGPRPERRLPRGDGPARDGRRARRRSRASRGR